MKILIIDANNTMYRAYHSYSRLQGNGKPTSIVYGMPTLVNALINQFKPDDIYLCWDGRRSPHRLKLLPSYKEGRKSMTEAERTALFGQKDTVMKLFYFLGLKQLWSEQMEADDWIYMLTRKLRKENNITIVSTDKDFHQLIGKNVKVYNTANRFLIHRKNLKTKYGYEPENCVDYLCMIGDKSDNIPGIRGVGPAKAAGVLQNFSSINGYLDSEEIFANIDKVKLEQVYQLNRKMIDLRLFYKKFLKGKIKFTFYRNKKQPKLRMKALFKLCDRFKIRGFKEKQFLNNYKFIQ